MKSTSNLVSAVIGQMVFARHGNATSAQPGMKDSERQLTELGRKQATQLAMELGQMIRFNVVVSSPLQRAMETTELATLLPATPVVELGVTDDETDPINIMFKKLGYATLSAYYEHELAEHLKDWARTAAIRVLEIAENEANKKGFPLNVFVGGHAVCQNALLWAIAELIGEDANTSILTNMALKTQLGEANALLVEFLATDGSPSQLPMCKLIQPTIPA